MLDWIGRTAESAWGWVEGQGEALWHKVVHFVYGLIHSVMGWVEGFWGVVASAWRWLEGAVDFLAHEIESFAGAVAHLFSVFIFHVIPSIWRWIAFHAKQAWHWVENAVKWAAKHIAHLAAQAWHWVQGALKWVHNHVLRPLMHLAAYVWHHLTRWAHQAWYLVTHPVKLAELLFWPLWYFGERVAWKLGRRVGKWLAELVLHNLIRMVKLVESVIADVL